LPLRYYVDNLRVFRFIQSRDTVWRKHVLETDDVDPQWRICLRTLGVDVSYALSPQAKGKVPGSSGKVERPYRWLQDRIVRTCALEKLTTFEEVRAVLRQEVHRYNFHQVHSTTGEIPSLRFNNAKQQGNSLFRLFSLPKPYSSPKDVFCLREIRTLDGYRRITFYNHQIHLPNLPIYEDIELHLIPDPSRQVLEVRIWWQDQMQLATDVPLASTSVHF